MLGHVACRTTSKITGIGAGERSWGDVKHLKSGKRSNLSGAKTEKQAILYTTAHINEARAQQEAKSGGSRENMWGDDDMK